MSVDDSVSCNRAPSSDVQSKKRGPSAIQSPCSSLLGGAAQGPSCKLHLHIANDSSGRGDLKEVTFEKTKSQLVPQVPETLNCRYVMFYEAIAEDDSRTISLAVSRDGSKAWKCLGKPVIRAGGQGSWDAGGVGEPCAVSMEGKAFEASTQTSDKPWAL